jgi:sulfur carrier protein ThiS
MDIKIVELLEGDTKEVKPDPEKTLAQAIEEAGLDLDDYVAVLVNDKPVEDPETYVPKEDDVVLLVPQIVGGRH